MKSTKILSSIIAICLVLTVTLCSCGFNKTADTDEGNTVVYTEDMTVGQGSKTFICKVVNDEQTFTFTVNTDAETVGDAMLENGLITGEEGQYGLYIKTVNGITADYDIDGYYWAFYINGEYATTGIDGAIIEEGAEYSLVRSKG